MYAEDDLVPLSALQHFVVCPRQCALIHLESTWIENVRTAEGRVQHERVDLREVETRNGVRQAFGVPLRSLALGLAGRADVVEFPVGGAPPFPVEHKRGKPKAGDEDRVQLCAQALCLEEMLGGDILKGALFYGEQRRRTDVFFDHALRQRTVDVAIAVHALFAEERTPAPLPKAPCRACSLKPACRPDAYRAEGGAVSKWIAARLKEDLPGAVS